MTIKINLTEIRGSPDIYKMSTQYVKDLLAKYTAKVVKVPFIGVQDVHAQFLHTKWRVNLAVEAAHGPTAFYDGDVMALGPQLRRSNQSAKRST